MAGAAVPVAAAGLALQAYGMYDAYTSSRDAAARRRAAAQFEANQLNQEAGQVEAGAQRQSFETGRTGTLVQSRALALAAASGGSASDPTVQNIISGIASETAYRKSLDLYQGEEKARQMRTAAQADLLSGEAGAAASLAAGRAAEIGGAASIFRDSSSLFARYGYGYNGPTGMTANYG